MARVPLYGQRKVKATPVATANFRSNASPDAFGAGIGRAVQNFASGLNDLGNSVEAVRQLDDAAIVDKHVNQYRDYTRERTYNPETGYVNLAGQDAVEGRGAFDKDINETRDKIGSNLTPQQKKLYDRKTQNRRDASLDTSVRHSARQRKVWYNETTTSTLNGIADDAIAMAAEPEKFQGQIVTGEAEIDKQAALNGWPKEKADFEKERWRSSVHSNLIKGLAPRDPLAAKAWLDTYGDQMSNTDRLNLEKALENPVRQKQAEENAQRILSGEDTEVPMEGNPKGKVKILGNTRRRTADEINSDGEGADIEGAPLAKDKQPTPKAAKTAAKAEWDGKDFAGGVKAAALELGVNPLDLATIISYETAGTFNPTKKGPVTPQWGQHRGLIQFGVPQAKRHGVDWKNPIKSQLGKDGAIVSYMRAAGVKKGMSLLNMYAAVNAGSPYKIHASDANNGGAPGSVLDKVNNQMAGHRAKAQQLLGGQAVGYQRVQTELAKIKDPKLRAETARAIEREITVSEKARRNVQRNAKLAAEKYLLTQPNFNPTKLPLEIQQQIGIEGMTKLYNYQDLVEKHGDVKTDEELFLNLRRLQAENPHEFSQEVDLFDYVDQLSTKDRRTLQKLQVDAIKDAKNKENKALTEGKSVTKAMNLATRQLKAAGVIKPGKARNTEANLKREAQFQRQLMQRMQEFQKAEKRIPTDIEVTEMVDQLLTPIIIKDPGFLWDSEDDALLFDAPNRKDGTSISINIPYESIDVEVRLAIKSELAKELGREPTKEEIKAEYAEFVLGN